MTTPGLPPMSGHPRRPSACLKSARSRPRPSNERESLTEAASIALDQVIVGQSYRPSSRTSKRVKSTDVQSDSKACAFGITQYCLTDNEDHELGIKKSALASVNVSSRIMSEPLVENGLVG